MFYLLQAGITKSGYSFPNLELQFRGDIKYGAKRPLHDKSISLHSKEIEFEHPVNKEILVIKCDPPDEFIPKI